MNVKSLILGGALAAALSLPAQAAILNSGFESGDLSDWTYTDGLVEVVTEAEGAFSPPFGLQYTATEGDVFAQLTAGSDAGNYTVLFQSFTVNTMSRLFFDAAFLAFDIVDYNDDAYVRVFSGSTNEVVFASDVAAVGDQGQTPWTTFFSGRLAAGDYVIEAGVRNIDDGDPDYSSKLLLDNVGLAAVPEPATWAMMILGFASVGAALRRRSRASCPV
ncbi:MAG: PEPxxWA-CTERM sorting domain-containing protein [Phenylobacterium sp.]|nr:PEPxxWA-CTERM sorting domain-containing protein [Phenylobacterium sp.]